MTKQDPRTGVSEAALARAELYDTLGKLKDQLNYARRIDDALDRAKERMSEQQREEPAKFAAIVSAVAAGAGLAVWGIARVVARRFE